MDQLEQINIHNYNITYIKKDNVIGFFLKNGAYWDEWMLKYFQDYYIKNTDMVDIGAHIGTTSLLMSEVITKGNVIHSFEPLFDDILELNIKNNNKKNVIKLYNCGLGEDNYQINKPIVNRNIENNFGGYNIALFHDGYRQEYPENTEKIKIRTLDSFNLTNISLIKIDVEGYELNVLQGANETLRKNNFPTILIEIWENDGPRGETIKISEFYLNRKKELIKYLENLCYSVIHIVGYDHICIHKSH